MKNKMKKLLALSTTFFVVALVLISSITSAKASEELTTFTKEDWVELWSSGFGEVRAVAYSPDGSKLAVGGDSADISIINTLTYELESQLIGHIDRVRCIVWSEDSSKIIAGSEVGNVKIWSVTTGEELKTLVEHYDKITAVALSSNQKYLATGTGRYERLVRIFDYESGGLLKTFTDFDDAITSIVFSPDCKRLACSIGNPEDKAHQSRIKIFELATGKVLTTLEGHENNVGKGVESIDWSQDGNYICSGGQDNTIKIWDANTYESIATLTGHEDRVNKVLWSKNGEQILSCSDDETIKLWDVNKKEVLKDFVDDAEVKTIDFSKAETHFASGSLGCKVKIWDLEQTSAPERELYEHTNRVTAVDFSPNGKKIASGSRDYTIRIWDANTGKCLKVIDAESPVFSIDWCPDGTRIVSGHSDSRIKVWSATTYEKLYDWRGSDWGCINGIAWAPDCKYIASASDDGRGEGKGLRIWYPNGTLKCLLRGHFEIVEDVSWAPNGTLLCSASDDRTLRIWDVETEKCLKHTPPYTDSFFYSCAWSPDSKKIAGGVYSSIRVYDSQLNFITSLGPLRKGAIAVDWSQDSDKLASGAYRELEIWDVSESKRLSRLPVPLTSSRDIYGVKWHPSNKIVSCEYSGVVRLWRSTIGIEVTTTQKILSGSQTPLEISCFHYNTSVARANITIFSELGRLSRESGESDSNGKFNTIFYAPETRVNLSCQIKITASKPGSIYLDGKLTFTLQIYPKVLILDAKIPLELKSRKNASLELNVSDYIAPVPNARVNISSDYGVVEPTQAKTAKNGKVNIIFTAPKTKSKTISNITVTVSKEGYPTLVKYFHITILPEKEALPVTGLLVIYCSIFIIPPVIGVGLALAIIRKKSKQKAI